MNQWRELLSPSSYIFLKETESVFHASPEGIIIERTACVSRYPFVFNEEDIVYRKQIHNERLSFWGRKSNQPELFIFILAWNCSKVNDATKSSTLNQLEHRTTVTIDYSTVTCG